MRRASANREPLAFAPPAHAGYLTKPVLPCDRPEFLTPRPANDLQSASHAAVARRVTPGKPPENTLHAAKSASASRREIANPHCVDQPFHGPHRHSVGVAGLWTGEAGFRGVTGRSRLRGSKTRRRIPASCPFLEVPSEQCVTTTLTPVPSELSWPAPACRLDLQVQSTPQGDDSDRRRPAYGISCRVRPNSRFSCREGRSPNGPGSLSSARLVTSLTEPRSPDGLGLKSGPATCEAVTAPVRHLRPVVNGSPALLLRAASAVTSDGHLNGTTRHVNPDL
jgi:hypothetical protein